MTFRRSLRAITMVGLIAVFGAVPGIQAAEQVAWGEAGQVGTNLPSSWFPEITADQTGTAWAVWETTRDPGEPNVTDASGGAIMLARLDEQGWSEPANILVKDIYNAGRPILLSDGTYLHLLVRTVPAGGPVQRQARMFHMRAPLSADPLDAHAWSQPQALSDSAAYWAQMVILPDGTLVATYNQITDVLVDGEAEGRMVLYSRRSSDHGEHWSPPVRISQSEQRIGRNSLIALPDGTLMVAWDEGYDNLTGAGEPLGAAVAFSTDGGLTWEGQTTFRQHAEQAALATNGERVLLLYRSTLDEALYYRESLDQGRSWSDELPVPGVALEAYSGKHNFHKLGVATDSAGATTVAYVGPWDGVEAGLAVFTITYSAGTWGEPVLAASNAGYPEYPRLAVALGNQLKLVFFVREERFVESGRNTIWAGAGTSSAPAVAPQPVIAAPEQNTAVSLPPAAAVQPAAFPTTPPAPDPVAPNLTESSSPQSTLAQPVLWVIAATVGVMLTILAMLTLWRSFLDTRV